MKNMKRIRECRLIRQYYMKKFAKETGNKKHTYHGIFVTWDSEENKYCLRGESLPAHPDLREKYPNGWSMLDFITEQEVSKILGEKTIMQNRKRILSVRIIRQQDTDPDTSYLGEYSNRPTSEYSIDRLHSEDCASVQPVNEDAQRILTHARAYVAEVQSAVKYTPGYTAAKEHANQEWEELEEAYTILDQFAEESQDCDCHERGDMQRNEFRYFNPSFNYVDGHGKIIQNAGGGDTLAPEEVRKYVRQDYNRMESYNHQNWCYLRIRAEAEISLKGCVNGHEVHYHVTQTVCSGSLWGIESDSEKSYLESVEQEELSELRAQLKVLGFSTRAISTAFKSITHEDN